MERRVTLICSAFPPETGAAPGRMYHMAQLLQQHGFKVTVLTALPNYPAGRVFEDYRKKSVYSEQLDGITVHRTWLIPSNSGMVWKRLLSSLSYAAGLFLQALPRLRRSDPELIIVSSPPFITGYCGLLLAARTKAIRVLNVSDLWPGSMLELGAIRNGWRYKLLKRLEHNMYRRADAVCGQSVEILDEVHSYIRNKPAFLYRNLHPAVPEAQWTRPAGKRKLIYAGLLGVAQGVLELCRAVDFAALGTELHIYGEGYEKEELCQFIATHPQRGISYHGSLPAAALPAIFSRFHASLIPLKTSIPGAVPSKIFNAVANGLPVLFSAGGEGSDIVTTQGIGLANPAGDYTALIGNIQQMVTMNEEKYHALRNRCLAAAAGTFNKEEQDRAFVAFLEKLMESRNA